MNEVAVIVPTHNRPRLLAVTLRSILAQREVDLAVVVVDDGSSQPSAVCGAIEVCADSRVRLIRHDQPRGVCAARNTGMLATTSEWVALCDDDDVWAPGKLRAQLASAREDSAPWAYAGDVAVDIDLTVLNGAPPLPPDALVKELEHWNPVPAGSSNVMMRRSVLDAIGLFDSTLLSVGDWDLWLRLSRHARPACVPQPYVGCRVHGVSITRNRRLMLAEVAEVAARHRAPVDLPRHLRWAAWNAMLEGRRLEAVEYYARAVRHGDLVSIARAAVALVQPGYARRQAAAPGRWALAAQEWLDELRAEPESARAETIPNRYGGPSLAAGTET
jgi:glycosyltransferase involved in cell wall biosynthesis